ncbi:hypothetical protein MTR_3g057160 [Medicago truncatula]|uniref:Uncharacterized protein n=1 Tax=Medicago truncatula TaxID=3880 RepID=G7J254_MEDTR|nr:hypothetical protein MTR_3g057160 [Medicago truncatula]
MENQPEIRTGSVKLSGPNDWRSRRNMQNMSISKLISKLRDTFIQRDFDAVEETLVAREAMLKTEIKEKKKKIELFEKKFQMERSDKISVEMELKRVKEERYKNELVKNGGVVKGKLGYRKCIDEVVKKRKIVDFEDENVGEKIRVGEQRMKDGGGGSDNRPKSSPGAVQKNLATKLVEPKGEFASSRGFAEILNIVDGLDSDSSSSGSDS